MSESADTDIEDLLDKGRYGEAFALLLGRYQNKVFRLCCSILFDEALAEDAAQEIFLRVWKSLAGYRRQSSLSTWIYSISRNTCLTQAKKEVSRRTVPLGEAPVPAETRVSRAGTPDVELLLSALPERHRQVLVLFYFEEKSYEEVAKMLDIPLGTVKTYLHRAKKELGAAMEAEYGVREV